MCAYVCVFVCPCIVRTRCGVYLLLLVGEVQVCGDQGGMSCRR